MLCYAPRIAPIVPRNLELLTTGRSGVCGVVFAHLNLVNGGNKAYNDRIHVRPKVVKQIRFASWTTADRIQRPTILV